MFFFTDLHEHSAEVGRTIGVQGDNRQAAIAMSQRIWDGLSGEEPALGYSLLDTRTGRVFYVEVRRSAAMRPMMPTPIDAEAPAGKVLSVR